jgi:recombination protein RecA
MPESFYDDNDVKDFSNTRQVGQFAKDLGQACRMVLATNFNAAFLHISQIRMDLGNSFMPGTKASGGKEVEHLDSLRIKLFSSKSEKQAVKGQVMRGGQYIEDIIGRTVTWNIDKNKINGRYGTGQYNLITQGDNVGIDKISEVLDYAVYYGLVEKKGPWIVIFDEKFQGKDNAVKYLREHDEVITKLEEAIDSQSV